MKERVHRVCDAYAAGANRDKEINPVKHYELPRDGYGSKKEYNDMISKVQKDASDLSIVIQTSRKQLRDYLKQAVSIPGTDVSLIKVFELFVLK